MDEPTVPPAVEKMGKVVAPWTVEQVASLNEYQASGVMHPFTCGVCRDRLGTWFEVREDGTLRALDDHEVVESIPNERLAVIDRSLVATRKGWLCPTCDDVVQDWSWEFMANDAWRVAEFER